MFAEFSDHTLCISLKLKTKANYAPITSLLKAICTTNTIHSFRQVSRPRAVIMSCKINNNERVQVKLDLGGKYPLYGVIRTAHGS